MFFLFPSLSPSLRLETKTTGRHSCSIRVGLQFVAASSWPVIKANRKERENERRAIAVELNAAVAAAVTDSLSVCLPADPSASSDAAAAAASVICVDLLSL